MIENFTLTRITCDDPPSAEPNWETPWTPEQYIVRRLKGTPPGSRLTCGDDFEVISGDDGDCWRIDYDVEPHEIPDEDRDQCMETFDPRTSDIEDFRLEHPDPESEQIAEMLFSPETDEHWRVVPDQGN